MLQAESTAGTKALWSRSGEEASVKGVEAYEARGHRGPITWDLFGLLRNFGFI